MVDLSFKEFEKDNPKTKEEPKKDLGFQELPKDVSSILKEDAKKKVEEFTKSQPIPMVDNQFKNNLTLILHPDFRDLELMIRGLQYVKRFNPITQREEIYLEKIPNHPLNEYGINTIMADLRVWCSPEIKLGRKNEQMYANSVVHIGKSVTRLIYKNLKNFGMVTQVQQRHAKRFCNAIIEFLDSSYSRSIGGRENDNSRPTEYIVQSNSSDTPETARILPRQIKEGMKN